jgi:FixJ family two-component response regulator
VNDRERFGAVELAVAISPSGPARTGPVAKIRECIETLTPREAGVFALVVTRILNKQTARELGIVEKTVKVHRARGMEAMRAGSLAELVQLGRRSGCHRGQVMSVSALASDVATDRVGPRSHIARSPVQYDALEP